MLRGFLLISLLLTIAAIAGDTANYQFGKFLGPKVLAGKLHWLNQKHLDRTHQFYERHGGKTRGERMPGKRANVKNEKQYEALKEKGMSKERAARIANSPGSSSRGGKSSSRSSSSQGRTTAQKKAAGRKGGRASARKS